ncbi:metalloendopeptidases [Striga asiatica]|uniref:Metalloendopeptidases n=1 Tax=Striga asiatica TaxID=4170 RepID=A0A5A7PTM2_STRAF|nr:metalloendopeptidases [Striga asiatica]
MDYPPIDTLMDPEMEFLTDNQDRQQVGALQRILRLQCRPPQWRPKISLWLSTQEVASPTTDFSDTQHGPTEGDPVHATWTDRRRLKKECTVLPNLAHYPALQLRNPISLFFLDRAPHDYTDRTRAATWLHGLVGEDSNDGGPCVGRTVGQRRAPIYGMRSVVSASLDIKERKVGISICIFLYTFSKGFHIASETTTRDFPIKVLELAAILCMRGVTVDSLPSGVRAHSSLLYVSPPAKFARSRYKTMADDLLVISTAHVNTGMWISITNPESNPITFKDIEIESSDAEQNKGIIEKHYYIHDQIIEQRKDLAERGTLCLLRNKLDAKSPNRIYLNSDALGHSSHRDWRLWPGEPNGASFYGHFCDPHGSPPIYGDCSYNCTLDDVAREEQKMRSLFRPGHVNVAPRHLTTEAETFTFCHNDSCESPRGSKNRNTWTPHYKDECQVRT